MRKQNYKKVLRSIRNYLVFFALTGFIVTCCMLLFLNILSSNMGINLTAENIGIAGKLTFGNVILLTFLLQLLMAYAEN